MKNHLATAGPLLIACAALPLQLLLAPDSKPVQRELTQQPAPRVQMHQGQTAAASMAGAAAGCLCARAAEEARPPAASGTSGA